MAMTSSERSKKRAKQLNKLANDHGYKSWGRLSTAILRGDVVMILKKPDKK